MGARLGDSSQTNWMLFSFANRVLAGCALLLSISYFLKKIPALLLKSRFWLLIIIAVTIRIFSVVSSPNPPIDVFYILRDAPKLILEGKNPYKLNYPAPYGVYIPQIIFVYGPLTPFIFLPSVILFNDPRYMLIIFDLATAFLIYKLGKSLKIKESFIKAIIIIFLFHPLFPFMIEHAWLEPVMTFLLLLGVYCFNRQPKSLKGPLALGAVMAIKNVYFLPLAVYLAKQKSRLTNYLWMILVPLVLSLPFLIADPKLFLERTLTYSTNSKAIAQALAPTDVSLSIAAVILKYTHIVLPNFLVILAGIIVSLVLVLKNHRTQFFSLLSVFLIFIVLFMFGPFVFLNYFAFLGNILLFCLLLSLSRR